MTATGRLGRAGCLGRAKGSQLGAVTSHLFAQRSHLVFETADIVVVLAGEGVIVAGDGVVVLANREAFRTFGYDAGELVGHAIEKLVPSRFGSAQLAGTCM